MATMGFMLYEAAVSVNSLDKSKTYANYYPISFEGYCVQIDSMDIYEIEFDPSIEKWLAMSLVSGSGFAVNHLISKADYDRILNTVCTPQPPTI